jgi:hypothetical protein
VERVVRVREQQRDMGHWGIKAAIQSNNEAQMPGCEPSHGNPRAPTAPTPGRPGNIPLKSLCAGFRRGYANHQAPGNLKAALVRERRALSRVAEQSRAEQTKAFLYRLTPGSLPYSVPCPTTNYKNVAR